MPRETLTQERIVEAAIALLDREGLEGLSMRALGERLSSAATAVYWHVGSKDNLITLAGDHVWNEIPLPDPDTSNWRAAAMQMATDLSAMLARHPWLVQAFGSFVFFGPGKARYDDHTIAVYEAAGFSSAEADQAIATVFTFALGNALGPAAVVSLTKKLSRNGHDPEAQLREKMARARDVASDFPRLRARLTTASAAYAAGPRDTFAFGLQAIFDGLDAQLANRPSQPAGPTSRGRDRRHERVPGSAVIAYRDGVPAQSLIPLLEGGAFFESPRWHDGRWWVSDFYRRGVYAVSSTGTEERVLGVEHQPSGLGWMPDGSLLIVSMKDQRVLRRDAEGSVSLHADLSEFTPSSLNDMVVDDRGRAWVGCFGFDLMSLGDPRPAPLMRIDPDGAATVVAAELMFPNGSVITPDGTTLIVGETAGCRYTAFTIASDGSLTDRRIWAQLAPAPALGPLREMLPQIAVGPDGCSLDAEGHIWAADEAGGRCIRIAPGGAIVDEIRTPDGLGCFACALGGDDGRTLLVCAAPDFLEAKRDAAREAVLLTATVAVPHAGLP